MTAADRPLLTPPLALAYLRELSVDVGAAAVLDGEGAVLAGDPALAARAHALLAGARDEARAEAAEGGTTLAIRAPGGLAIAVEAGPRALLPLLEHDLRRVLADLAAAP